MTAGRQNRSLREAARSRGASYQYDRCGALDAGDVVENDGIGKAAVEQKSVDRYALMILEYGAITDVFAYMRA